MGTWSEAATSREAQGLGRWIGRVVVPLVVGAAVVAMIVIGIGFAAARLYDEPDYGCITDSPCDPEYEYPGAD